MSKFNSDVILRDNAGIYSESASGSILIGRNNQDVKVYGNLKVLGSADTTIKDKTITLNYDNTSNSGFLSGIEIEENQVVTGYIKTHTDRSKFIVKVPADNTEYNMILGEQNGDLTIDNDLYVSNTSNLNLVNTNDISVNSTLNISGSTQINSTLNVSSNTILNDATSINSSLNVSGSTNINSTLNVSRATVLNGITSLNSSLTVSGTTNITSTLNVSRTTNLNGATSINSSLNVSGATNITSTLNVSTTTNLNGATSINSSLNISGATNITSTLNVSSTTNINGVTTINSGLSSGTFPSLFVNMAQSSVYNNIRTGDSVGQTYVYGGGGSGGLLYTTPQNTTKSWIQMNDGLTTIKNQARIEGNLNIIDGIGYITNPTGAKLQFQDGTDNQSYMEFYRSNLNGGARKHYIGNPTAVQTNDIAIVNETTSGSLLLQTNSLTRMTINQTGHTIIQGTTSINSSLNVSGNTIINGNVGIGTNSPSQKLDVNGTIKADVIRVNTALGSSYINVGSNMAIFPESSTIGPILYLNATSGSGGKNYGLISTLSDNQGGSGCLNIYDISSQQSRIFINSIGNVGIDTFSVGTKLQINTPADSLYWNNLFDTSDVSIFGKSFTPTTSGTTNLGGTLFINSNDSYTVGKGSSIALGSRSKNYGAGNLHMTNARISGIVRSDGYYGALTFETMNNGTLYEGMRIDENANVIIYGNINTNGDIVFGPSGDIYTTKYGRIRAISGTDPTPSASGLAFDIYSYNGLSYQLTEALRIQPNSGNIGIGTTNPLSKLQIDFNRTTNTGLTSYGSLHLVPLNNIDDSYNGITFGASDTSGGLKTSTQAGIMCQSSSGYGTKLYFLTTNSFASGQQNRMIIDHAGNVGIGTTSPGYKLDVQGGDINASGSVRSNGTALTSDQRIKTNVEIIDDNEALSKLRQIEPKKYNYLDPLRITESKVYGFMAQEVRQVLPDAVELKDNYLPNILKSATLNEDILSFNEDISLELNINILIKNENMLDLNGDYKIIEEIDNKTYKLDKSNINKEETNIFVYGSKVSDFHFLKKDHLFTLNFAATQELDRKVQTLEEEKEIMKTQLDTLVTEKETMKTQLDTLVTEKETMKTQLDTLVTEKETMRTQLETLATEKETMRTQLEAIIVSLQNENQTLKNTVNTIITTLNLNIPPIN
jgi:hypothetical protein